MDLSNKNVIHKKNDEIQYLQFKKLLEYPEIQHAYVLGLNNSFKIFSNPNEEEKNKNELAKKSYKKICEELKIDYNKLVNTNQNHTDNIEIINEKINKDRPDFNIYENTDGLITNKKEIVLATINADCILLIFYDPQKRVIANVHSGWRGTLQRISQKTVDKMKEKYGCDPQDIICCMSPNIKKDHFEVSEDVYENFYNEFRDIMEFEGDIFEKSKIAENKYFIDTNLINKIILKNAGLKEENIIDSEICSVCNKEIIHSYRAHGEKSGRATLIISMQ